MHELVRAERILKELQKKGVSGPVRVLLGHITPTHITLEEVVECFQIVTEGSELEGSELVFQPQETFLHCNSCGYEFSAKLEELLLSCPQCKGKSVELIQDDELEILEITPLINKT